VSEIRIHTGVMRECARAVEAQMNIIQNCLTAIRDDATALRGNIWEGDSAAAYDERMRTLCAQQAVSGTVNAGYVIGTFREYAQKLNTAATEFDRNENRLEAKKEALPTDIFGI